MSCIPHPAAIPPAYKLVPLRNGSHAVHAAAYDEKMHPGLGPAAEAEAIYVRQLKIRERLSTGTGTGEFVVWDVGLGAAANVVTLLRLTRDLPCPLRVVSFDDTAGPAAFALENAATLEYLAGYESQLAELIYTGEVHFHERERPVHGQFVRGDFPSWLATAPANAPDAIMFDAFSPARNPAMWTQPVFANLFRRLDPARPCNLTTYSRSTLLRVTLLLAGFFVGRGAPTGLKEETTVAANSRALLDAPLDRRWLDRAHRSDSAEPLTEPVYRRAPLSPESAARLGRHPQFA